MELSLRLKAVADLVTPGYSVADVGTDHGYVPIYLIKSGKNPWALAMDINRGPLEKAEENIALHNLGGYIETRLSDGLSGMHPEEAESVVIAGMGGGLVIRIMEASQAKESGIREWILQPQSEIRKVRRFLKESGYRIAEETMVLDDGKFYTAMRAQKGETEPYSEAQFCYGKRLLEKKHPVLKQFLQRELRNRRDIMDRLRSSGGSRAAARTEEIEQEIKVIQEALEAYVM